MGRHPMCVVVWSGILHGLQVLNLCAWTAGDVSVSVLRGLNAKLPCDISNAQDVSRLSIVWSLTATVGDGRPTQVILYQGGTVTFSPWGTGARARFVGDPRRSGSVVIEGAQRDDAGLYQCITVNPARQHQPRIHTVRLNVLEVPSPPQCVMRGEEELGATMLLICDSSSGNPAPTYSWWKVDSSGNQILNNSHTSSGILLIQNLSVDSSGVYLCIASNVLASESCSMTLTLEICECWDLMELWT
ncbi:immunoglobulin superfamily member 11-like [Rhinoraja longicauda]